jgi:hypothetical protein
MSNDTKWVIGVVVGTAIALAGLIVAQSSNVNGRIDRLDDRLRAVEIGLAEVKVLISGGGQDRANDGQSPTVTLRPGGR